MTSRFPRFSSFVYYMAVACALMTVGIGLTLPLPIVRASYDFVPKLTPTAAAGTTVNQLGGIGVPYKVTVDKAAFVCAATTCDVTLATLPAKTKITGVIADLTQAFACTATCTSATLSFTVGKSAGGNEYLLSADADAATGQFGLTNATSGASLVANLVQSGDLASWSGTTTLQMRMTSGTGNIGNASVTNFSAGSLTVYVNFVVFP